MPLAASDVALFSIWIHPSSVLPSKSDVVADSPRALLTPAREPAMVMPASLAKALRLGQFASLCILTYYAWPSLGFISPAIAVLS